MSALDVSVLKAAYLDWLRSRACRQAALVFWLAGVFAAAVAALPAAHQAHEVVGRFPGGDSVLFEPGAVLLLDILVQHAARLRSAIMVGLLLALITSPLLLVASSLLYTALGANTPRPARAAIAPRCEADTIKTVLLPALTKVPAFLLIWLAVRLAQAVTLLVTMLLTGAIASALEPTLSERASDLLMLFGLAVGAFVCALLQLFGELSKSAASQAGSTFMSSLQSAALAFRTSPRTLVIAWALPQLIALLVLLGAAHLVESVDVARPGLSPALLAAFIHQSAVLCATLAAICAAAVCVRHVRGSLENNTESQSAPLLDA